jgi:hypothetical protein
MVDLAIIFELSKTIVQRFDAILYQHKDFANADKRPFRGRIWCDLTNLVAYSSKAIRPTTAIKGTAGNIPIYEGSVEHLLQLIFSRFERGDFQEGMFLVKADYGAEWFTPILQQPHCILRQTTKPKGSPELTPDPSPTWFRKDSAFDSYVLFYLGPRIKEFCATFHPIGLIPGVNSWYFNF